MLFKTTTNLSHRVFFVYFLMCFAVCAYIAGQTVAFQEAYQQGIGTLLFIVLTLICYATLYLVPAILLSFLVNWSAKKLSRNTSLVSKTKITAFVLFTAVTSLLLFANFKIYSLYGTYINGFIVNLVITPGGIDSLGGSAASSAGFALIAVLFLVMHIVLFWLALKLSHLNIIKHIDAINKNYVLALFVALIFGVHFTYAASDAFNKKGITNGAISVPFFQTVTSRHFFKTLGFDIKPATNLDIKGKLKYPLNPLQIDAPTKPLNIIWLTSESWRADTLDPHIMPATWKFAETANRFTQNYSGGNGTRMGVFSMFTGLPGNYWFPFLDEHRGAALIDVLQQQHYQMHIYTSAEFSYPEFEKTLFSKLQKNQMQSLGSIGKPGWERDRMNVSDMLHFIDTRDKSKPFFTFMFFESPHARYFFPKESIIATPYSDDINYATLDKATLGRDIKGIKNRYINAVHHLDSQFERVFNYLDENNLRDNTIVILLGDHGEEFMEHGYWGHNSTFVDEQVRTPLVIYAPNQSPLVSDKLTSHMDVIPTIMPLLGVKNKSDDYAIGYDLFNNEQRAYTYIADWSRITYMDQDKKITLPVSAAGFAGESISGGHDEALSAAKLEEIKRQQASVMNQIFNDLHKFMQKNTKTTN